MHDLVGCSADTLKDANLDVLEVQVSAHAQVMRNAQYPWYDGVFGVSLTFGTLCLSVWCIHHGNLCCIHSCDSSALSTTPLGIAMLCRSQIAWFASDDYSSNLQIAFGLPRFPLYASYCVSHMTCIQLDTLRLLVSTGSVCTKVLRQSINILVVCNRTGNDNLRPNCVITTCMMLDWFLITADWGYQLALGSVGM